MNKVIVWSKNNCPACSTAKLYLESKNIDFEERNIEGDTWTKEDLFKAIPTARSVPLIQTNEAVLSGIIELRRYFD